MKLTVHYKGGKGSGFHGHAGRLGKVGGSSAREKYPGFTTSTTNMPWYDNMLKNPEYFRKAKGVKFHIESMTPDDYMIEVAHQQHSTRERLMQMIDVSLARKYAKMMEEGFRFPMLMLDKSKQYSGQEGRHRAVAATLAIIDGIPIQEVPVMVVEDV